MIGSALASLALSLSLCRVCISLEVRAAWQHNADLAPVSRAKTDLAPGSRQNADLAPGTQSRPNLAPNSHKKTSHNLAQDLSSASQMCANGGRGVQSIFDVLGQFPEPRVVPNLARSGPKRVAMCMFGHVRTFVLPGVHSSIARNVMGSAAHPRRTHVQGQDSQDSQDINKPGAVDLFFLGHLGNFGHTKDLVGNSSFSDTELQEALNFPGLNLKYQEVHESAHCEVLQELWQKEGTQGRTCPQIWESCMPFMWMDRCVDAVKKAEDPYDLIIMSRPDVGVFAPMPWDKISFTKVNYMKRAYGMGEDWFFTLPMVAVDTYWHEIREIFRKHPRHQAPDRNMFVRDRDPNPPPEAAILRPLLEPLQFPAVIVRNGTRADCERLETMKLTSNYRYLCDEETHAGYWTTSHFSLD